ncbi:uncharacterized protein FIBRA_03058 [Fibroporia radiculosa]|uniref:Uncharacterized protein n=1 Tax=Fibroporia radiculosa TaxID=599839 RepID=J4GN97_9APHY|nr:uncharacterized protein FIBRA_03058 [Fibroporia radiculosa]CCM01010.1 predicted protein [Fibroporia radiculosa]
MATADTLYPISIAPAPLPPILGIYPSSPIAQFPPPLPGRRRPLRERCGLAHNLKIQTNFSPQAVHAGPWSPKGHLQPHRNNLPRRRKVKRIVFHDAEVIPPEPPIPPQVLPVPPQMENRHLQEVVPGLYVAFKLSDAAADAQHIRDTAYTHLLDICYPPPGYDSGAIEQVYENRVHRLRLVLPVGPATRTQRAGLGLTNSQLRAARDFLAQALPYSGSSASSITHPQSGSLAVRILLSTPMHRPTDAMTAAGCYLAFVSGKSVETTLRFIDDEDNFLSIWKGEVSEDEVEQAERVAKMWSWLSNMKR